jgi:hypothetical protein
MRTLPAVASLLLATTAGCGPVTVVAPPGGVIYVTGTDTPYAGGDVPNVPGVDVYTIAPDVGTHVSPGIEPGYGITARADGTYRIVWTGDTGTSGVLREFYGSVWTPGRFTTVVPGCVANFCALEAGDNVSNPVEVPGGQRIDWDTFAADSLDGFDFNVDTEPVYFEVFIDGESHPELVHYPDAVTGNTDMAPGTNPFGLSVH